MTSKQREKSEEDLKNLKAETELKHKELMSKLQEVRDLLSTDIKFKLK